MRPKPIHGVKVMEDRLAAMPLKLFLSLAVCGFLVPSAAGAGLVPKAARDFRGDFWSVAEGLPALSVRALLQARDGYLWIGTETGLARFDGLKFVVFTRFSNPEMVNDECHALAQDDGGAIWIGTSGGLLRYEHQTFTRFTTKDGLRPGYLNASCPSRSGGLWIGTNSGLNRYQNGQLTQVAFAVGAGQDNGITCLSEDEQGVLWIGSARGLERFNPVTGQLSRMPLPESLHRLSVAALSQDAQGQLWMIGDHSLYRLQNQQWESVSPASDDHRHSRFIYHDPNGAVWTAGFPDGLNCWDAGRSTGKATDAWLNGVTVFSMISDREGDIWIGSSRGLSRWKQRAVQTYSSTLGLPHSEVNTVYQDARGAVWLGSEGGLSRLDLEAAAKFHGKVWPLRSEMPGSVMLDRLFINYSEVDGLINNAVRSLAEDASGRLWIATIRGVSLFHEGKFTTFPLPGELSGNKIHVLCQTADGAMWIGSEAGLHQWQGGRLVTLTESAGLSQNHIRALFPARDGSLWVGTLNAGVNRLTWPAQRAPNFELPEVAVFSTEHGLSDRSAHAFHEDADGTLWIGTERGLNRFHAGQFAVFTTREGLPENVVNSILEDDVGKLWIGCQRGIYRVSRQALNAVADRQRQSVQCVIYDKNEGFLAYETNGQQSQPAAWKTRDGQLWFACVEGAAMIDPPTLSTNGVAPPVLIERVVADGALVLDNATAEGWKSEPIVLTAGLAHSLDFQFTANSLADSPKNRFKYRLEGHERDWIDGGSRRSAHYAGLVPGTYQFQVMACNNQGLWNETGASLAFRIAPLIYQTWTFKIACFGAVMVAAGLFGWREWKILRLRHSLALEKQRTRLARDIHVQLGAKLTHIAMLSDDVQDAASSLGTPPSTKPRLDRMLHQTVGDLSDLVWTVDPTCDSLEALVAYISQNAEELFAQTEVCFRVDLPENLPKRAVPADVRHRVFVSAKKLFEAIALLKVAANVVFSVRLDPLAIRFLITLDHAPCPAGSSPTASGSSESDLTEPQPAARRQLVTAAAEALGGLDAPFTITLGETGSFCIEICLPKERSKRDD